MEEIPTFDVASALRRVEQDKVFLKELIDSFFENAEQTVACFHQLFLENNFIKIIRDTHALKSALANLGAMKAANLASKLELSVKLQNSSPVPSLIALFEEELKQFKIAQAEYFERN